MGRNQNNRCYYRYDSIVIEHGNGGELNKILLLANQKLDAHSRNTNKKIPPRVHGNYESVKCNDNAVDTIIMCAILARSKRLYMRMIL